MPHGRYREVFILGYRARALPGKEFPSPSGSGVMPGPPSLDISPHPGKTSTAHQFVEGKFVECYEPTVESTYKAAVADKDELQLRLDKYTILPHSFIIGIHSYVLVYSVTSLQSMPVVLLGNKTDPTEVTMGTFMKLIEEINQVGNSYGRSTSCCLM
ncbi:GTPase RhebL1 [Sylvia borin]